MSSDVIMSSSAFFSSIAAVKCSIDFVVCFMLIGSKNENRLWSDCSCGWLWLQRPSEQNK